MVYVSQMSGLEYDGDSPRVYGTIWSKLDDSVPYMVS